MQKQFDIVLHKKTVQKGDNDSEQIINLENFEWSSNVVVISEYFGNYFLIIIIFVD